VSAQTKALLLSLAICIICIACQPAAKKPAPAKPAAAGPTVRATVVTIRTSQQPEKRTLTQTLVIAGDRARDTGEHDLWRLYDTKANTVTFVDDLAKTFRTELLTTLIAQRRAVMKGTLPPHYQRARVVRPGTKKALQGVNAELLAIENGAYKRELWLGEHPSIPKGLFAMMYASDPPTLPLAPIMRDVDEALTATRAFPLADRAEVPVARDKLVIDRSVVSIAPGDVAQSLLAVPKGYRDVTVKARKK
jgi:hypothetical protein